MAEIFPLPIPELISSSLLLILLAVLLWYRRYQQRQPLSCQFSLQQTLAQLTCPAWIATADCCLAEANPRLTAMCWPIGQQPPLFTSPCCQHSIWPDISAELQQNQQWQGIAWYRTGTTAGALQLWISPLPAAVDRYFLVMQQDISQQQEQLHSLQQHNTHDDLTGLFNETMWLAQLQSELQQCEANQLQLAVLQLELTELPQIRQQFGEATARQFEQWAAQQLQQHLPAGACPGQLNNRRFAVLLCHQHCQQDAHHSSLELARQLQMALHGPCPFEDYALIGQCSIGIACYPLAGTDGQTLLQHGHWALQQCSPDSGGICFWQQPGRTELADPGLASELQIGLKQYQFALNFQPCYRLEDKELWALDVNLVWHSPKRGLLNFAEFSAVAEHSHLLLALEHWQFQQLCQHLWQWQQQHIRVPVCRLEMSALHLQQPDLKSFLLHHLQEWQLSPAQFAFTVTEQYWLQQPGLALLQLQSLAQAGFSLIWRDFGIGQSALSLLQQQFWSDIMLAPALIADLENSDQARNSCACLIRLVKAYQFRLTAQGIDNEMQGYLLHVMGCDSGQGPIFGTPLNAAQTAKLLDNNHKDDLSSKRTGSTG